MRTEIARWGNSLAVRLPRHLAKKARLDEGSAVDVDVEDGHLVIRVAAPRYGLDELIAGITDENLPEESFDDAPRGRELL